MFLKEIKNILVIRPDRLGDLVMTLPLIKTIRENLPEAKIYLLASNGNAGLLKGDAHISDVFSRERKEDLRRMCSIRYDLAIDTVMDWRLKSAFLARKSRAKFLIGFALGFRGRLFDLKVKPEGQKPMSEFILDLIRPLGLKISSSIPEFLITPQDKAEAERYWANLRLDLTKKIVVIHPGGYYPSQRWMPERFAQVAGEVEKRTGAQVIIMATSSEVKIIESIKAGMEEGPLVAMDWPLRSLAVLFSKSSLFIGNNSGPLHLAAAVGTPTISFLGPTVPHLWRPQGENQVVLKKELSCSPCQKAYCRRHRCLKEIEVNEVIDEVSKLWKRLL